MVIKVVIAVVVDTLVAVVVIIVVLVVVAGEGDCVLSVQGARGRACRAYI